MFGGSAEPWAGSDDTQPKLADTTLLQFSKCIHITLSTLARMHACAARVTVVDNSVSLSVCPSVCPSVRLSVRQTLYRLNLGNGKSHGKQTFLRTINHE